MKQEDDGSDVVGNTVKYAIDLQTDGGAWQTVLETAVLGKTTSGYERSHRIDLPQAGSTWTLRLRKISSDANSVKVGDVMTLQSYTEVIDALRYPNTAAALYGSTPASLMAPFRKFPVSRVGAWFVCRITTIRKPANIPASGPAGLNGPGRITRLDLYDIVTADRFGLGNRLSSANISKWTLYWVLSTAISWFLTGAVVTAWSRAIPVASTSRNATILATLRDFAAIFRGMTCWNGEQIVVQADMPRDVDFTYTRANIVGKPRYSSSSSQVRYTNALVSWSDPDNAYADTMEPAFIPELVSRYSS